MNKQSKNQLNANKVKHNKKGGEFAGDIASRDLILTRPRTQNNNHNPRVKEFSIINLG